VSLLSDHLYRELEAERPSADPDEDRAYDLQRELDAEGRGGSGSGSAARPSSQRRASGPDGGTPSGSSLAAVRSSGVGRGGAPHPPGTSAAPSSALPRSFATLADRRYLARVARVIPRRPGIGRPRAMPDALLLTVAGLLALCALCSFALGVWLAARDAWADYRRKRGGYIDFHPSPPTRRSPRGTHRRRP